MQVALVGLGQAGGKLAQAIAEFDRESGFGAVKSALAVNTASTDLQPLDIDTHLIGRDRVSGHGVGGDNELGTEIMREEVTEVVEALNQKVTASTEAILLIAGLGGGTGSGGAPVLARRLREIHESPVYGLGILPGESEGQLYQANAGRSLKTFVRESDSLLLIDNDAWRTGEESVGEAFDEINRRIARRIGLLIAAGEAAEGVGQSVVDSSEIINTLREGGIAAVGYASGKASSDSENNISMVTSLTRQAVRAGMSLPDATTAEAALLMVTGRSEAIPRKGVERARTWLEDEIGCLQIRGGDFPLDDERLAAVVLLGGIERSDRVQAFMDRAREAETSDPEPEEDPASAFRNEELEDLF